MLSLIETRPRSVPVRLELDGNICIVQSHTIQTNLPGCWLRYRRTIMRYGHLPMSSLASPHSPGCKKALKILFRHLSEVDRPAQVSTAITNSLEAAFSRSHGLHIDGGLSLPEVFLSLADLFHPYVLGCNNKIFRQMEAFFLAHSAEILTGYNPTVGLSFISALDVMSCNGATRPWDMTPALACLVRAWDETGFRPSSSTTRPLPALSSTSKRILKALALQSEHKRRRLLHHHHHQQISSQLAASCPSCPCPCLLVGGGPLRPPALTHRPHSHHGDFRPSAVVPGQAFHHPEGILQFCLGYPEFADLPRSIPTSGYYYPYHDGFMMGHEMMSFLPCSEEEIAQGDPYYGCTGVYADPEDEHLGLSWSGFVPRHARERRLVDRCR